MTMNSDKRTKDVKRFNELLGKLTSPEPKSTMEERFDDTFDLDNYGKSTIVNDKVKQFIRSELSSLARAILEKRKMSSVWKSAQMIVKVEDIEAVCGNRGFPFAARAR